MIALRRVGSLFLLCGWLSSPACGPQGAFLHVEVDGIPAGATALTAHTLKDDELANQEPSFALNENPSFGLGLILDRPASGRRINVTIGAHDQTGCLIAVGDAEAVVHDRDTSLDLHVTLAKLQAPLCETAGPQLLGADQVEISSSGRNTHGERGLDLIGWGFRPGMQVLISGHVQCPTLASFRRLHLDAPLLAQTPGIAEIGVASSVGSFVFKRANAGAPMQLCPVRLITHSQSETCHLSSSRRCHPRKTLRADA